MKATVTLIRAGGETLKVEIENDMSISEVFEAANVLQSGKVGLNGVQSSPDAPVQAGDIITEAKPPEGGR